MKKFIIISVFIFLASNAFSQSISPKDSLSFFSLSTNIGIQIPASDIANRFGVNSNIGLGILYKKKSNLLLGISGNFLFGNNVKEDNLINGILNENEQIVDYNGQIATIRIFERGFQAYGHIGKIFPVFNSNPNSGIILLLGSGVLQHKIFYESIGERTPQLSDEYKKGYDRLSNGLSLNQFIGYIHFNNNKKINFYAGFDFSQAWTKNRRSYNFDTMSADNTLYFDSLNGFKTAWILPLYKKSKNQFFYY